MRRSPLHMRILCAVRSAQADLLASEEELMRLLASDGELMRQLMRPADRCSGRRHMPELCRQRRQQVQHALHAAAERVVHTGWQLWQQQGVKNAELPHCECRLESSERQRWRRREMPRRHTVACRSV